MSHATRMALRLALTRPRPHHEPRSNGGHMQYTVIGSAKTRAARVLWMLEELGQPYEHVAAAPRSDHVVPFNPVG